MLEDDRTISGLLQEGFRLYLYFDNEKTMDTFIKNADAEGFTYGDGVKIYSRRPCSLMALNNDKTINFLGFCGTMAFYNSRASSPYIIRVDYKKYISGKKEFSFFSREIKAEQFGHLPFGT